MKIFFSIPMNGKSKEQINDNMASLFDQIKQTLPEAELVESVFDEYEELPIEITDKNIGVYCLGLALQAMAKADLVVFANGWQTARGCRIERMVAEQYGKLILEVPRNNAGLVGLSTQYTGQTLQKMI